MSGEDLKATVLRVYDEAFNKGDLGALDELFAPNMTDRSTAVAAGQVGLEGFKKRITGHRVGVPDLHFIIEDLTYDDDKLAFRWSMSGTHQGPWLGRPATGKPVTVTGMNLERLEQGKIVEHFSYPDVFGAMQQLGFIPKSGQAKE